jgi:aspartate/glutamate/glutamine transport system substrate-binding protein
MKSSEKKLTLLVMSALIAFGALAAGCGETDKKETASKNDSGQAIQKIKDRGVLKVGCKIDVPLFGFKNPETEKIEGFEIDLAKAVSKKIFGDENKIEFTPVTAKTRGPLLDSGELDMICATYTINEERKKQYNFTEPYYTDPVGLLVKKSDNIQSLKDLDGKTIAVPQGATTRKAVSEAAKKDGIDVKFAEFPTYTECKAALMSGRAAAYAMDQSNLHGYVDDQTVILPDSFAPQEYGIATKKDNKELCDYIDQVLKEMKKSGEMDQLLTKWKLKS